MGFSRLTLTSHIAALTKNGRAPAREQPKGQASSSHFGCKSEYPLAVHDYPELKRELATECRCGLKGVYVSSALTLPTHLNRMSISCEAMPSLRQKKLATPKNAPVEPENEKTTFHITRAPFQSLSLLLADLLRSRFRLQT